MTALISGRNSAPPRIVASAGPGHGPRFGIGCRLPSQTATSALNARRGRLLPLWPAIILLGLLAGACTGGAPAAPTSTNTAGSEVAAVSTPASASAIAPTSPTPGRLTPAPLALAATPPPAPDRVETLLATMSLDEKLGQMVMFGFFGREVTPGLRALITEGHAGNLILLPENAGPPEQVAALTAAYQDLARAANRGTGLLVAADQEGGWRVTLTEGFRSWPRNSDIGSAEEAAATATGIAREMRTVGITMNLAPVLDVNDNPANPVIGWRSYGTDPAWVGDLGLAAIAAYQRADVVPTAKHFPGHGNTDQDSHVTRPVVRRSRADLDQIELAPFRRAVAAGVDAIMTAHVVYTALDPERPATLSPAIITGLLREEMGYEGVVISDDFTMEGVLAGYGAGPAAVLAVLAGVDMIMAVAPESRQREILDALHGAVRDGKLTEARIDQSVRRILRLKERYGLLV